MNDYILEARLGFSVRQVFGQVHGSFEKVEGTLRVDGDEPSSASVELTFRTGSIQTLNERRDEHLRRSFLEAAEYPLATFVSTEVRQLDGGAFRVSGVLTIRGVAKVVSFDLRQGDELTFRGELTIDRRDWQVMWNGLAEGWGLLLGYDVDVRLDVTATRRISGPVRAGFKAEVQ
jgi:polyisoprenoid-binding protein YceI